MGVSLADGAAAFCGCAAWPEDEGAPDGAVAQENSRAVPTRIPSNLIPDFMFIQPHLLKF
jgi:hypothetical protein